MERLFQCCGAGGLAVGRTISRSAVFVAKIHMLGVGSRVAKPLIATVAFEGLLARVKALMLS